MKVGIILSGPGRVVQPVGEAEGATADKQGNLRLFVRGLNGELNCINFSARVVALMNTAIAGPRVPSIWGTS